MSVMKQYVATVFTHSFVCYCCRTCKPFLAPKERTRQAPTAPHLAHPALRA